MDVFVVDDTHVTHFDVCLHLIAGDGLIQEKELAHVMRACMDENGMKFDEGEVDELTRLVSYRVSKEK